MENSHSDICGVPLFGLRGRPAVRHHKFLSAFQGRLKKPLSKEQPPLPPPCQGYKKAMHSRRAEGALFFLPPDKGGVGGLTLWGLPLMELPLPSQGLFQQPLSERAWRDFDVFVLLFVIWVLCVTILPSPNESRYFQ